MLGANDGLVSNLSLVMGVAGASVQPHQILLTGLAGLVAGAGSMAMGEWLSVNSAREMAQRQIDAEARELDEAPEMEKEELILIYQAKGLDEASARSLADKLFKSHEAALDTLVREELGVDPEELGGSAWAAAGSSFCLFAVGAIFPVLSFFFLSGWPAIAVEPGAQRIRPGLDRRGDLAVHRQAAAVQRRSPARHRLGGGAAHLRGRPPDRRGPRASGRTPS